MEIVILCLNLLHKKTDLINFSLRLGMPPRIQDWKEIFLC